MKDKDDFFGLSRSQERERERDFQIGNFGIFNEDKKCLYDKKKTIFLRRTYCYYIICVK